MKFGGEKLWEIMTNIFNAIVKYRHWPHSFNMCIQVIVYKGKDKDPMSLDEGYRGITLLTVISKVFDMVILDRLKVWSMARNIPHPLQGAARKNVSCMHTSFVLHEAVSICKESSQKLYCAFLDTRKAFDTVWTDALLVKMWDMGIRGKTWDIMRQSYCGRKGIIKLNGCDSRQYSI